MPDLFSTETPPPMRPWDYVRLRRLAAGRTIEQAARPHWHRPEHQEDVERTVRRIEEPGHILRADYLVDVIQRSFPFDPQVYFVLRDCPPEQHPAICRGCGATKWDLPTNRDGSEATLLPHLVCSSCEERREETRGRAMRRAA